MADESLVEQLLDEITEAGRTPEEVCDTHPELLPEVRRRWRQICAVEAEVDALFPVSGDGSDADSSASREVAADLPRIPGYDVDALLGRGGMGVVYKARHRRLDRPVALKRLLAGAYAGPPERERFQREAEAVAGLQHANIVQLYDAGDLDGRPYFTMEFVEGGSLAERIVGMPQPARPSAAMLAQVAEAVQFAHRNGIVHRDLKPANIMLAADGTPKVTDFGLARRLEGGGGLTLSGVPVGTPSYMAPEQARGDKGAIGPVTDVYALGSILYEMLTGRPPFRAETATGTLQQVLHDHPVPPSRLNPSVLRDLETVCLKCLHKEPQRRYATAAELAADLARFLADEPIHARPVGRLERLGRWCRRNPAPALLAGALIVTSVAGLAAIVWQWRRAEQARDRASTLAGSEAAARHRAENAAARLMLDKGQALCDRGEIGPGLLWLARGLARTEATRDADLIFTFRANLAAWAERLTISQVDSPMKSSVQAVAFHPDGRRLLVVQGPRQDSGRGLARVWDPQTWKPLTPPLEHLGPIWDAVFSPDGRLVLTGGNDGKACLWETESGRRLGAPLEHEGNVFCVAFAPDGKTLATGGSSPSGGEARVWDTATLRPLTPPLPHHHAVRGLAFSPDGKTLLTGSGARREVPVQGGEARLWNVATGRPDGPVLTHTEPVFRVGFYRDGRGILTTSADGLVRLWDRTTGRLMDYPLRHGNTVRSAALSPDGRTLLTGGGEWYALRRSVDMELETQSLDGFACLWDLATGTLLVGPLVHPQPVTGLAFRGDGKVFATSCIDGHVRIWASLGSQCGRSYALEGRIQRVAYSPDGRYLVVAGENDSAAFVSVLGTASGEWRHLATGPDVHPAPPVGRESAPDGSSPLPVAPASDRAPRPIHCVACSPSGRTAVTTGKDGLARLWDLEGGRVFGPPLPIGGTVDTRASFSPDGRAFVTSCQNGPVRVWEAATGRPVFPALSAGGVASAALYSPDGRVIATGGKSGMIALWDAATGRFLDRFAGDGAEIRTLAFSHDGRTLVAGCDGHACRLDARTGQPVGLPLEPHEPYVWEAEFNRDDTRLLTLAGDEYRKSGRLQVWDAESGLRLASPTNDLLVLPAAAFHPDGRLIATGDWEGKARLWDATSGTRVGPVLTEHASVYALAFSPDGRTLAVGARDGTLTLWPITAAIAQDPERIRVRLEWLTRQELDEAGLVHDLSTDQREQRREKLLRLGGSPSEW